MGMLEKKAGAAFPFNSSIKGILGNKTRKESLQTSIRLILTTPKGKMIYNPELGSQIPYLVFDIITDDIINLLYYYVEHDLEEQDIRIKVTNISIYPREQNKILLFINYEDRDDTNRIPQQVVVQFLKEA